MTKEKLEEAAERYEPKLNKWTIQEIFKDGAKWQQKRMYSEEEVFNLLMEFSLRDRNSSLGTPHSIAKWFEKNKKK